MDGALPLSPELLDRLSQLDDPDITKLVELLTGNVQGRSAKLLPGLSDGALARLAVQFLNGIQKQPLTKMQKQLLLDKLKEHTEHQKDNLPASDKEQRLAKVLTVLIKEIEKPANGKPPLEATAKTPTETAPKEISKPIAGNAPLTAADKTTPDNQQPVTTKSPVDPLLTTKPEATEKQVTELLKPKEPTATENRLPVRETTSESQTPATQKATSVPAEKELPTGPERSTEKRRVERAEKATPEEKPELQERREIEIPRDEKPKQPLEREREISTREANNDPSNRVQEGPKRTLPPLTQPQINVLAASLLSPVFAASIARSNVRPGHVYLEAISFDSPQGSRTLYVCMDLATHFTELALKPQPADALSAEFLLETIEKFPYRITQATTPNHPHFGNSKGHPFASACAAMGVGHKVTVPSLDLLKGYQRMLAQLRPSLLAELAHSEEAAASLLADYSYNYNYAMPQTELGNKTPWRVVSTWFSS